MSDRRGSKVPSRFSHPGTGMTSKMSKKITDDFPQLANLMERVKQVPDQISEAPPAKFGKFGAGLILGGIGFGWVALPYIISFAVQQIVHLEEGSDIRKIWNNIPQAFDFKIWVFNITNPDEVQKGGIPVVAEIGPYYYKEWKGKVDLVDDFEEDTITYSNKNTWYFMEKESYPLTGEEIVTIPHVPLFSMLLIAEADFPAPMLTVINAAIPKIFGKLKNVFMKAKVRELLFDGIYIDCRARDVVGRTVCVALKQNSRPLVKLPNNQYLFSVFGVKNATPEDVRITVKRGVKDSKQIGSVVKLNGKSENSVWLGEECNKLTGTDSTIFPPFRGPDNMSIIAYSPEICRSLYGRYEKEGEYKGIKGHIYTVNLGDMINNPKESCYCPRTGCLKKGVTDLTKCQGAPLVGSLPHFYLGDESYQKGVVGLRPEKSEHEITFMMEPISGTPLVAKKRLQFNLPVHSVRHVNLTRKLKSTLIPIFWVEEGLELEGELMNFLEANLLTSLRLADGVKWTLIVVGSGLCIGGIVQRQRKKTKKNPRVSPSPNNSQAELVRSVSPMSLNAGLLNSLKSSTEMLLPSEHPHIPSPPMQPVDVYTFSERLYERLSPNAPPLEKSHSRLSVVKEDEKPPSRTDEKEESTANQPHGESPHM
ncbi:sensory neuron membrane protein 1-like [Cimex lectularius]|uniref:Sensory neuron membrane protein n=1 Tax=Cimex lectularius TaxID=79782 RepID=A0A8I6RT56_CIMLE|nr:sensory neuron membrane protein 1-like [Cimex lectularius]